MSRFFVLFISLAIAVHGRPHHHKYKKAHVINKVNELPPQGHQQPSRDKAPTGPPKNVNVYNMNLHKFDKNNKINAQLNAHSVAIAMQGPGMVELDAGQTQVAPGEPRPDHTISIIKETPESQAVHVMKVKNSGQELPVNLPLSELPGPKEDTKKPNDLGPVPELQELATLSRKPHRKIASHHINTNIKPHIRKANARVQHPDKPQEAPKPLLRVHQKVNKEDAHKIFTKIESTVPVNVHQPEHEEHVVKGHKIKLSNEGEAQRVFGKADSNNVALTMQGPGTASVTSHLQEGSQTIIFDPKPPELCPDKNCPQQRGGKRHKN